MSKTDYIYLSIPIDPATVPTAQQKGVRIVHGKPMFYTRKPLRDFMAKVKKCVAAYITANANTGQIVRYADDTPLAVRIAFYFNYPKSTPKCRQHKISWKTTRPDVDNQEKAVMDCLADESAISKHKRVVIRRGFFADDSQVANHVIRKYYTTGNAGIVVTIAPLPQGEVLDPALWLPTPT